MQVSGNVDFPSSPMLNSAPSPVDLTPANKARALAELELRRRERLAGPLQGFIPAVTRAGRSPGTYVD